MYTHVYDIGQIMDVVFKHGGIGSLQGQQVLIPGFKSLQFVLWVLCLPLLKNQTDMKRWEFQIKH